MADTPKVTVFAARRVVTLDPSLPVSTHVAVREGRIIGHGGPEVVDQFAGTLDARFADKVIVPGFIEGHGHATDGLMWRSPYVGYFARTAPDGSRHGGFRSIAEAVGHLKAIEATMPPGKPLVCWGFDPIYFDGPRMTVDDLDIFSPNRMVVVAHVSGHILNVNTKVLTAAGFCH